MKLYLYKARVFIALILLFPIAVSIGACGGKSVEDTSEPVVSKEASIPEAASAQSEPEAPKEVSETEPVYETGRDTDLDPGVEVIVVEDLEETREELPILKKNGPEPKSKPDIEPAEKSIEGSWFLVAEVTGNKLYKVYVDTESIENVAAGVESWSKLVFEVTQSDEDGLSYNEVHIQSSIDCAERTYAYNSSKFYNAIGQLVYHEDIAQNSSPIEPGDLSAQIADFVCGNDLEDTGG